MKFFETLPKIVKIEADGRTTISTNILSRVSLIADKLSDPTVFYEYDIQEGDTPEIVADKYYQDMNRYWMVLLPNNILDPQWDWPMSVSVLNQYITEKYNDPYAIHHYEKIITTYESTSQITTTNVIEIDEDTYNTLDETTNTYEFPSGTTTITVTKKIVSLFDYEIQRNESKRKIKLLRRDLTSRFEKEFKLLMA